MFHSSDALADRGPRVERPLLVGAAVAMLGLVWSSAGGAERVVRTTAELQEALVHSTPGLVVRLQPGEYLLERPMYVPDGVSLVGSGRMAVDADGTPSGLEPAVTPTIRAAADFSGDLLTLGDRTELRALRLVVPAKSAGGQPVPSGNVVVVGSRRPGDRVAATLRESEILTESRMGADAEGPTGRGVLLMTRNPATEQPHEGARLRLTIDRCIVRAPSGNALLANNFASGTSVALEVRRSVVEGITSVSGGTSRPDFVTHAGATFRSEQTLYRRSAGGSDRYGWQLYGGSGIPNASVGAVAPGATNILTQVESQGDRIEGFRVGVLAAAFRRVGDFSGPGSDNRVVLKMRGATIQSAGERAADLALHGAIAEPALGGTLVLPPGERNVVQADLRHVRGSGQRENLYANRTGPEATPGVDDGNRVSIAGRPEAFVKSNPSILPPPPATAF